MQGIFASNACLATGTVSMGTKKHAPHSEQRSEERALGEQNMPPLTPADLQLARLCRAVGFGRIEGLEVRGGEVDADSALVCRKTIRLDLDEEPFRVRREFVPSREFLRLFRELRRLPDRTAVMVTIQHGQPKSMEVILNA
jgi:hypothetical protein